MAPELIKILYEARMLVGFLGEKHQSSWWDCSFLSSSSTAFLAPVFPNSIKTAQYSGVCQAASIIHDEHIGVGKHFHVYRLPDSVERAVRRCIQDKEFADQITTNITTREAAIDRLQKLAGKSITPAEGPVIVGDYSDDMLDELLKRSLSHYLDAFKSGYKVFPYMRYL